MKNFISDLFIFFRWRVRHHQLTRRKSQMRPRQCLRKQSMIYIFTVWSFDIVGDLVCIFMLNFVLYLRSKYIAFCYWLTAVNWCVCHRGEDGEKKEKKKKAPKKSKTQLHRSSRSDEPDLQESAFWKKIIAYQRKLLVRESDMNLLLNDVLNLISAPLIKKH